MTHNLLPMCKLAPSRCGGAVVLAAALAWLGGCESAMQRVDRKTAQLMAETSATLGPDALSPRPAWTDGEMPADRRDHAWITESPHTENPPAEALPFTPADEAQDVMQRLEEYGETPADSMQMDLQAALAYAIRHSREYRFAEEDYVLSVLRLLIERHRWGPRLFDELEAAIAGQGDDALFDTALQLVNELRLTQRLPYGGEVSARIIARATEDLHQRVAGENTQTAELILAADIPLLRGAGQVAREDLIQAERNLIYGARDFERFRREFLFDMTTDFLNLVVQSQAIVNAQREVLLLEDFLAREKALVDAGLQPPFEAALVEQRSLSARNGLINQRETFRLTVDRFKVRLGMPQDQPLTIVSSMLEMPVPKIGLVEAVRMAMHNRLDLQNRRDQLDDSRRGVANARNDLLADLNLTASVSIPTDDQRQRAGFDFDLDDTSFRAGLALDLPLDRTIERLNLRQAQISLERSVREYDRFRDMVAVNVRGSVRDIDRSLFSVRLQEENIRIAERRLASIAAAPDRASARDRSEAAAGLLEARDDYDRARRDLQVAVLQYILDSGQLRVDTNGSIRPLRGMKAVDPGAAGP